MSRDLVLSLKSFLGSSLHFASFALIVGRVQLLTFVSRAAFGSQATSVAPFVRNRSTRLENFALAEGVSILNFVISFEVLATCFLVLLLFLCGQNLYTCAFFHFMVEERHNPKTFTSLGD